MSDLVAEAREEAIKAREAHFTYPADLLDRLAAALEAAQKDAERYRAWRYSHSSGMRPFLPRRMPAEANEIWTYPCGDYDPPDDAWMRGTRAQRDEMIDAAIDAAIAERIGGGK